jgi:hypothetical protein
MFEQDSNLVDRLRQEPDPISVLQEAAFRAEATTPAYTGDIWLYRIALGVLSSLALAAAIGSIVLVMGGTSVPEVLVALGSASVGALVGLFAPSPAGPS